MRRLMILGNCVAQHLALLLQQLLDKYNAETAPERHWSIVQAPPVYNLAQFSLTSQDVAKLARQCNVLFSQPLFNFGPLNTAKLQSCPGLELHTFSAPNFEAYFPDVIHAPSRVEEEKFPPPLEWHSRVFLECQHAKLPVEAIEKIYLGHPVFRKANVAKALDKAWAIYEKREKDVEIGTLETVRRFYAAEPLFFTWKHPGDRIIATLLSGILERLGLKASEVEKYMRLIPFREKGGQSHVWSEWGFGFNAWPIISRSHSFFNFPGREFFRVAGKEVDIMTAAIAWRNYYDKHPKTYARLLEKL